MKLAPGFSAVARAAGVVGAAAFVLAGCEVVAPPAAVRPPEPAWAVSTPFPDVRSLKDVIVLSPELAYAVGTGGTILKYDGTVWTREETGVTVDLEAISGFVDGQLVEHLLVVGGEGTVLSRTGTTWTGVPSGTTDILFSVAVRNELDAIIVGDAGRILRWNGSVITDQTPQTLQLVVGNDGSQNLFPIPEALKGVGDAGDAMLAVGARGAVYTFDANANPADTNNKWNREDAGTTRALAGIFTDSGIWVPTVDGVLMQRNGPGDWDDEAVRTPAPVFLQDVYVDGEIFAVGLSEDIYHFDGSVWNLTTVAEAAELRAVDGTFVPPKKEGDPTTRLIFAVGGGGRIARGPLVLPVEGETQLSTRESESDFVQ